MAKVGRPTKYKPEYCEKLIEYFDVEPYKEVLIKNGVALVPNKLPVMEIFARSIDVHKDTLYEWADKHPEFSVSIKKAMDLQRAMLLQSSYAGAGSTVGQIFQLKNNHDYKDKKEHDVNSKQVIVNITEDVDKV